MDQIEKADSIKKSKTGDCSTLKNKVNSSVWRTGSILVLFIFLSISPFTLGFAVTEGNTLATESHSFEKVIFGCYSESLVAFEKFVIRAKQSGATHIILTAEDLPWSDWQYDVEHDPYPSWVISNIGLLKISTPEKLKPYIPQDYAETIIRILEQRCAILRKYRMKGMIKTFEPQMLPEAVFRDHPLWRGARVEHPLRARAARFAPSLDNPEVLQLYQQSISNFLSRCPEIDMISLHTNDSGTGLDWSGGLYSGASGNTRYKNRKMEDRLYAFFDALKQGAQDVDEDLEIDMLWTRENRPDLIAHNLATGMAIENLEGPAATPYKAQVGFLLDYFNVYYPAQGIPHVIRFLRELERAHQSIAPRLVVMMGDRFHKKLYFELYDRFMKSPYTDRDSEYHLLRDLAISQVGDDADHLVSIWYNLWEIQKLAEFVNNGGFIFYLGSVQQRWLTRPFVPFPDSLLDHEKDYYRKYQFQGRAENHADDLVDLQGYRYYAGTSGRFFTGKILSRMDSYIQSARDHLKAIHENLDPKTNQYFELFDTRLQALSCLCQNAKNAVSYQSQLQRLKELGYQPQFRKSHGPVWDRQWLLETARREIDNTAVLMQLLSSTDKILLDVAPTLEKTDIRRLEPNLIEHLQKKLDIMNAHWMDYNQIFTINWRDP